MRKTSNLIRVSPISYVYFALFFISGVSGLIYESIWSQYLKQFLGHAAYAQTLVLVIYMGGMAAGSWLASVWSAKFRGLLFWYAVVEIALGALALVFHNVFILYLDASFNTVVPFLNKPLPIALYKWVSASLIILPQSMLLGATFPLMAGGILRRFPGLSGYKTSFIYFVNTLGASIGVLISGFYLVREWGLRGAIVAGGLIDLFVGTAILALCLTDNKSPKTSGAAGIDDDASEADNDAVVFDIDAGNAAAAKSKGGRQADADDGVVNDDAQKIPGKADRRGYYYPLLFVACATASASFIYEIGWIRMLSLVLGSSTHSFELMLSAFILGLALGSFFVRNRLDGIRNAPRLLGVIQMVMGATAVMTLFIYGNMFEFMVFTIGGLAKSSEGYVFFNVISHIICMIIMLPSTICAGMVIPLIIHMLYKRGYGEQAIGKVYAFNTFGGILGVIVAVWALMELVGLKFVIIIGGAIDMGIGVYVLYRFRETRESFARALALPAAAVILLIACAFGKFDPVLASSGVFRYGSIPDGKQERIVKHIDGRTASITLFKSGRSLVLSTNGKPDASVGVNDNVSSDEYTMSLLGLLPLSIHENPRTAAVIGMGAGMTSHYMLHDLHLERLDVVEIERAMTELAEKIGPKVANTFKDPRSNIYIEDAKTFFSARNSSYDIIVSEPSNPWVSGVSSLFSKEFFRHIRNHINDGGLLMQWFHIYEADMTILVSILKALAEYFPVYEMYLVSSDLLIVAAKEPDADISIKRDVFLNQRIAESMAEMGFSGVDDMKLLRYADQRLFNPLINTYNVPANSDYHSFVDLYAAKYRFMGDMVNELTEMRDFIIPVQKMLFADTNYMSLSPNRLLPEIPNMHDIQAAKAMAQEIVLSAHYKEADTAKEAASASVFILDYASVRPERTTFTQIQSAIIQILQKTLPFLSTDEMREIWEVVETKVKSRELQEDEAVWMDYFKALCNYDMPEIRRLSLDILSPIDTISGLYSHEMLLASLLTSAAALDDGEMSAEINRVWERYIYRKNPPAPIRLVRALLAKS